MRCVRGRWLSWSLGALLSPWACVVHAAPGAKQEPSEAGSEARDANESEETPVRAQGQSEALTEADSDDETAGRPLVHLEVTRRRRRPVQLRRRVPATGNAFASPASKAYDVVCEAPCDIRVDGRGGDLFFVGGANMSPSTTFSLLEHRERLELEVRPGNRALLASGWVFAVAGVLATVGGGVTMTLADDDMQMLDAGAIALGAGLVAVVSGGIMVWQGRTKLRMHSRVGIDG